MLYTIEIDDNDPISIDHLDFGVIPEGAVEGWPDIYINIQDTGEDIFTDSTKNAWIEWLNACCGDKHNPKERVVKVVAKTYETNEQSRVCRSIEIEKAYLASYIETSIESGHSYVANIRPGPVKGKIDITAE